MSLLRSFCAKFVETMEKRAAMRVHEYLGSVEPERLAQAGISTQQLAKGPSAYPWRLHDERVDCAVAIAPATQLHAVDTKEASIRAAIAELQAYSNAELADLGITRGEIAHAVRHGREGFERTESPHAPSQNTSQSTFNGAKEAA